MGFFNFIHRNNSKTVIYNGNVQVNGINYSEGADAKHIRKEEHVGVKRVENIHVYSQNAMIKVTLTKSDKLTARLTGKVYGEGQLDIKVEPKEGYLCIGSISSRNVSTNDLVLEINIPDKKYYDMTIKTENGDVCLCDSINVEHIEVVAKNGAVSVTAFYPLLKVYTKNGPISVKAVATSDTTMYLESTNGLIDLSLGNIKSTKLSLATNNGSVMDTVAAGGEFILRGAFQSSNGNVFLHA